ncbi:MAG: T9SS type A sorting domain-containing protein [Bacteroidia bacterium]
MKKTLTLICFLGIVVTTLGQSFKKVASLDAPMNFINAYDGEIFFWAEVNDTNNLYQMNETTQQVTLLYKNIALNKPRMRLGVETTHFQAQSPVYSFKKNGSIYFLLQSNDIGLGFFEKDASGITLVSKVGLYTYGQVQFSNDSSFMFISGSMGRFRPEVLTWAYDFSNNVMADVTNFDYYSWVGNRNYDMYFPSFDSDNKSVFKMYNPITKTAIEFKNYFKVDYPYIKYFKVGNDLYGIGNSITQELNWAILKISTDTIIEIDTLPRAAQDPDFQIIGNTLNSALILTDLGLIRIHTDKSPKIFSTKFTRVDQRFVNASATQVLFGNDEYLIYDETTDDIYSVSGLKDAREMILFENEWKVITRELNGTYRSLFTVDTNGATEVSKNIKARFGSVEDTCVSWTKTSHMFTYNNSLYFTPKYSESDSTYGLYKWDKSNAQNEINLNTELKLFPNPSKTVVHFNSDIDGGSYQILSTLGQVISKGVINEGLNSVPLKGYPKGQYILIIESENEIRSTFFIKE